jgi:allophanate hydrolase
MGATGYPPPSAGESGLPEEGGGADAVRLAVAGLHLSGQPLNGQLLDAGARLSSTVKTAPCYRMFVIERPGRRFPGLVRSASGAAVELEIWEMTPAALGAFLGKVCEPLCIGTLELENGERVKGFLAESWAAEGARDITALGGWRAYLAQSGGST